MRNAFYRILYRKKKSIKIECWPILYIFISCGATLLRASTFFLCVKVLFQMKVFKVRVLTEPQFETPKG